MAFNFNNIRNVEFFIQKSSEDEEKYYQISIDNSVKTLLRNMLTVTSGYLQGTLQEYSPTEKYNSYDKIQTDLNGAYATNISTIYNLQNITVNNAEISIDIDKINYYFAKYTDSNNQVLLAIKRATYFKSLTTNNGIISWMTDSLKEFNNNIFKLDKHFDILVFDGIVKINSYSSFEHISELASVVKEKSTENITTIQNTVSFLSFTDQAQEYIKNHITAARLVASISKQSNLSSLNKDNLARECGKLNISVNVDETNISFDNRSTLDFLKLLDRRLYAIDLTGENEIYEAKSKTKKND